MPKYYFERLEYLDHLIRRKATGTPTELARKFGISERTVYDYIEVLRSLGAPITYDRVRNTYRYQNPGKFCFQFMKES